MIAPLGSKASPRPSNRTRRRLSRTFSRARWSEYARLLELALGEGYRVRPVEEYFLEPSDESPVLLLRHDVDQAPKSVLAMSAVEQRVGVRSSWYLRWRTAHPDALQELRLRGGTIGLHYETLSRRVLAGATPQDEILAGCREELKEEIAAFIERFGPIRSVCAHGDTRVPSVRNWTLLEGIDASEVGIALDLDRALRSTPLGAWLSDRSRAEGSWKPGMNPTELIRGGVSPLLCLTHPNNWISGGSLWLDRFLSAALPDPADRPVRMIRTRSDAPPITSGARSLGPPSETSTGSLPPA